MAVNEFWRATPRLASTLYSADEIIALLDTALSGKTSCSSTCEVSARGCGVLWVTSGDCCWRRGMPIVIGAASGYITDNIRCEQLQPEEMKGAVKTAMASIARTKARAIYADRRGNRMPSCRDLVIRQGRESLMAEPDVTISAGERVIHAPSGTGKQRWGASPLDGKVYFGGRRSADGAPVTPASVLSGKAACSPAS